METESHPKSVFPLDKDRRLLSETVDSQGVVRKVFRLFAEDGTFVDVEYEIHKPQEPGTFRPTNLRDKIVAQEGTDAGFLKSLKIQHEGGQLKDYQHIDEATALNNKRKLESAQGETKKTKTEEMVPMMIDPKSAEKYYVDWKFTELLLRTHVEYLNKTENGKIFVAYRHELATDVFKGLVQHGFLSCPVLNKRGHIHYGFIDVIDIVHYFIGEIADKQLRGPGTDLWSMLNKQAGFKEKRVKDLMTNPMGLRQPFHPIHKGYSLYSAIEALGKEKHLHRVPIVDEDRRLINIITQSQIIDFVAHHLDTIGPIKDKPLSQIPTLYHHVERILSDQEVIEAFKIMERKNLTGIAVVNADDKLVGADQPI